MANENDILLQGEELNEELIDSLDFDELEERLLLQLDEEFLEMESLVEEGKKIGTPDNLGEVMGNIVWEQFINQVAVTAGEDFIKENRGLTLDLRKEAHFQTTENFAKGKIATHNTEIDYQKRYDDWQGNFKKDDNGNVITHKTRSGREEATLKKGARKPFDEGRPKGSAEKGTDMDHTISAAEIIRDAEANAHMSKEEQIKFANSDANLNEMDSALNRSKGDKSITEWLDNPNSKGQKAGEIFNISEEKEAELHQKDLEARKEYGKRKKEGVQKSIEAGKKSRREEAFRISGKALRSAIMLLLTELLREIAIKLIAWLKSANRELKTFLNSIKEAIESFIAKIKTHLLNAGNAIFTTLATAIYGPIVGMIKKVWIMLKQSLQSLKNAISYLKDPANKNQPLSIKMMEVGKIVVAGLTAGGGLLLGEVIEKSLMAIPIFAFQIPLLGSLANILGIFSGALIAGIIGAMAINSIQRMIENRLKSDNINAQIKKGNEVSSLLQKVRIVSEARLENTKAAAAFSIYDRHLAAANEMKGSIKDIIANCETDTTIQDDLNDIDALLNELKG